MAVFSEIVAREKVRLLKTRTLPSPGNVLVKQGDTVGPTAVIAKTDFLRESPRVLDLKVELNAPVTPELMDSAVTKEPGEPVMAGEVIARFDNGKTDPKEVVSPCSGTIQYISRLEAKILIREDAASMKPMYVVPVSSLLKVNPRSLRTQVTVKEGQHVKEGQIIAGFPQPGNYSMVYAPISGVIARICPRIGTVTIVRPMKTIKILAHVPGKVMRVLPNQGAVIESFGKYIEGIFGVGSECHGPLQILTQTAQDILQDTQVDSSVDGKIIVAGAGATYEALEKAVYLGAKGIISGGLNQKDMASIFKMDLDSVYVASNVSNFTMVMTEGAGFMPMNAFAWNILKKSEGRTASLDGTTKLSGDLLRPWIFIAENSTDRTFKYDMRETGIESRKGSKDQKMKVLPGNQVRCVRQPYFGLWGTVESIPPKRTALESEGLFETVRVRLDNGTVVNIAEANIEVIGTS